MTKDIPSQSPDSEPSVLEYLRSKLFFWRGENIELPAMPEEGQVSTVAQIARERIAIDLPNIPWRIFLILGFMLAAQMSIEFSPVSGSENKRWGAIALYIVMAALAWGLQWVGDLRLALPAEQVEEADDWKAAWPPLLLGILLSVMAFLAFKPGNPALGIDMLFNPLNVSLWLAGIGFTAWGLWRGEFAPVSLWKRLRGLREQPIWNLKITRWGLAVAFAFLISVFYRTYMFGLVMPDMVSDHAEKLMDVYDVLNGQSRVFFPRNTGREPLQFYLIAWTIQIFKTGISFTSMKIGMIAIGLLSLPYIYLLGKEVGNRRVGLFAMLLAGMAFWPNILARVALRFILYAAFVAPVLFHLIRGLRTGRRNDFIMAGLFLGIGLHGYTPFRVVPGLVVIAVLLFILHVRNWRVLRSAILWLGIVSFVSLVVFIPLARFWIDQPDVFNYRWASRVTNIDTELPEPAWQIFIQNTVDALLMFNVDDGKIWVVSIPNRPALDFVSGGLLVLGVALLLGRYAAKRRWQDLLLLLSVPFLMLPSIMALAFPAENPAPNRASGVMVVIFVIIGFALDAVLQAIQDKMGGRAGKLTALSVGVALLFMAAWMNFTLTFNTYRMQFEERAWNTSEMGTVVRNFADTVGSKDQVWVAAFPNWVDTRLVGMEAGFPEKDYAIWPDHFESTLTVPGPKMFLVKYDDLEGLQQLKEIYPQGAYDLYQSTRGEYRNFYILFVP